MQFLGKWEIKLGWMSFPGFLRYYAIFHVMVYLLQFVSQDIGQNLDFNREKILAGEVWRLFTFMFASSGMSGFSPIGALFLFCMASIAFMMSDTMENAWGVFRTSLFFYVGYIGLIIANFLYDEPMFGSGYLIYESAFFVFATMCPKYEFRIFFIIPVQARWLAILGALLILFIVLADPIYSGYVFLAFANYIFWAGIPALLGKTGVVKSMQRRRKFQKASYRDDDAFHRCAECDRTDLSDPALEFRMAADGKEYCTDHLKD